ncbi:hypothetical protein GGD83_004858 [Rhodoblastus sphagnicola]|nr:hypothetical protein [Rhodoblastus sphagnicola]MBB4201028.1 hypothetical protein [Rhodoblastus sphagnicola]
MLSGGLLAAREVIIDLALKLLQAILRDRADSLIGFGEMDTLVVEREGL